MDVTCPSCAARYTANEDKLRGKTARMRCRACDTVWLVAGPTQEAPNMSAAHDLREGTQQLAGERAGERAPAARAAIVKRGAEREHRDLFASRPLDIGSVKQTLRPPPSDDAPLSGMAARNETSVLFTVDALRGREMRNETMNAPESRRYEPAPVSGFAAIDDDEGIIDLNALASSPAKVGSRGIAQPLFSEPPPAAFSADVGDHGYGPSSSHGGGFRLSKRAIAGIAAAGVALVLSTIGIAAAFKGEEPVSRSAATTMIMAPVTPAPVATAAAPAPAPADPAGATASASSTSDDDTKTSSPSGRKFKHANKSGGGPKASFTKVQSGGIVGTGVPAKAPKASDKCGCKGDFNCIIRCTATGK